MERMTVVIRLSPITGDGYVGVDARRRSQAGSAVAVATKTGNQARSIPRAGNDRYAHGGNAMGSHRQPAMGANESNVRTIPTESIFILAPGGADFKERVWRRQAMNRAKSDGFRWCQDRSGPAAMRRRCECGAVRRLDGVAGARWTTR